MTTKDYAWIRRWGEYLGSSPQYIERRLDQARGDNAPAGAIYPRCTATGESIPGDWATVDGITNEQTRWALGLPALEAPMDEPAESVS